MIETKTQQTIKDSTKDRLYSFLFDFLHVQKKKYIRYKDFPIKLFNGSYVTCEGRIIMDTMRTLDFESSKYNKVYKDGHENGNLQIYVPTTRTHEKLLNYITDKGATSRELFELLIN